MANSLLTRAQEFLRLKIGELSPAMQEDFANGNLNFSDSVYYKRYEITNGAGLIDLLYNDDAIVDGFCNISKQKIKQGCAIMIDRITVRGAIVDATIPPTEEGGQATPNTANAAQVSYLPVAELTALPTLQAAELEVDVAQLNIFQAPINSFNQESVGINGAKDGIILTAPKLISDSQELQFRLHMPKGLSLDSSKKVFIEVALRGAEIRVK